MGVIYERPFAYILEAVPALHMCGVDQCECERWRNFKKLPVESACWMCGGGTTIALDIALKCLPRLLFSW